MAHTPNPTTDTFDDVEGGAEAERREAGYPKKPDGSVDVDALTPEQAAAYWKSMHDATTTGFHKFKSTKDTEIENLKAELENARNAGNPTPTAAEVNSAAAGAETMADFESQIPNFDILDPETQAVLRAIFNRMDARLDKRFNSDPGLAFARRTVNERNWDLAFEKVAAEFPDLAADKAAFKAKYFQANNVPENIAEILAQLAKVHLFDRARTIGAEDEAAKAKRIDLEAGGGRQVADPTAMTIDDWERLRTKNPKEFARRSAEFNAALDSGQLVE